MRIIIRAISAHKIENHRTVSRIETKGAEHEGKKGNQSL